MNAIPIQIVRPNETIAAMLIGGVVNTESVTLTLYGPPHSVTIGWASERRLAISAEAWLNHLFSTRMCAGTHPYGDQDRNELAEAMRVFDEQGWVFDRASTDVVVMTRKILGKQDIIARGGTMREALLLAVDALIEKQETFPALEAPNE